MARSKTNANSKTLELATKKLASSGLDLTDSHQLGIFPIEGHEVTALCPVFPNLAALKINYYDPFGQPMLDHPKSEPFYRLRFLEQGTSFKAMTDQKQLRYVQLPRSVPVAYYPKNQTWSDIVKDTNTPILITEGELKAAKACKEGFPTIGLGGVFNWKSPGSGIDWLPSLEYVNWVKRSVYIVFDSDYQTNENVCLALKQLAEKLHDQGAFAHIVTLPQIEGHDKIGLDDFLTFAGATAVDQFHGLLKDAEPLGLTKPLFNFNERYAYVQDPGMIIDQVTTAKISPSAFKDHLESTASYQEKVVRANGAVSYKPVSASAAWLKWPLRNEVYRLTYQPGRERYLLDRHVRRSLFNIWPGWGVNPKAGDIAPFMQLIEHIFTGNEQAAKQWFLCWCAYPLQYPGTKMFSSAVLHGIRHGTGKSLVGYTMGKIYGKNFTEISQMDIHGNFNEWAEGKQFVMGDDVTGSNKRQDADFLKKLITQRELRINAKYVPSYVIPDCINYFFTANHPDSFFLEDDDRRFFISEVQVGPLPELFYMEYELWLSTGGAEAVFNYLLNLDLGDFNPAAPAFRTSAKERMIANVQSDLAGWVRQLLATPDHVLRVGDIVVKKDLFTSKELLEFYDPIGKTGTTANGLGRELARAGVRQVCHGNPIRISDGSQARYYSIRNQEHWLKVTTTTEVVKHLEGWSKQQDLRKDKKY